MTLPTMSTWNVADIKPYWRNPRRIPPEAVDAVADSITRYGYQQPIVVDRAGVVIIGHTRLAAVKKLGWTQVPVAVTDLPEDKAREYRLVDNRTAEMTFWDHDALLLELREFETELLETFFPEIDLEIGTADAEASRVTAEDVAEASRAVLTKNDFGPHTTVTVICPSCFHSFQVTADSMPQVTRTDVRQIREQQASARAELGSVTVPGGPNAPDRITDHG